MQRARSAPTLRTHAQRGILALFSALALALLAVGQALPVLHFALVQHQLCAEHGSLEHGQPSAATAHVSKSAAPSAQPGSPVSDEHEHCGVVAVSPTRYTAASSGAHIVPGFAPPRTVASESRAWVPPALSVLAYAPKLAPPA